MNCHVEMVIWKGLGFPVNGISKMIGATARETFKLSSLGSNPLQMYH